MGIEMVIVPLQSAAAMQQFIDWVAAVGPYVIVLVIGILGGALAPSYYALERMRGFGRAMVDRLPYTPPPGMNEEQALAQAMSEAPDFEQEVEEENSGNTSGTKSQKHKKG